MTRLLLLISFLSLTGNNSFAQDYYLLIGTYTNAKPDKGIYVYKLNSETGSLTFVSNTESVINPSYLAIAPNGKYVYACTETQMTNNGSISAFEFDKETGSLKFINKVPAGGDNPVYVSIHKSGKWLVNATYTGGTAAAFRLKTNGEIMAASQVIKFSGKSIIPKRQDAPHIHCAVYSPDQDYVYMPDLGTDKIWTYHFAASKENPLQRVSETKCVPGSGPRHLTFHPNKQFAYGIEELSGHVSVYQQKKGKLASIQRIAAHDTIAYKSPFASADIHVAPDGKFLYTSNRGKENNIAIYSIDTTTGKLTLIGYQSTLGEHPRNFVIDPSGNFLLVGNMNSNTVVVFKRDIKTGLLFATGNTIEIPQPACLKFVK